MPDDLSEDLRGDHPRGDRPLAGRPPRTIEGVPPESTFSPPAGISADTTMLRNVSEPTLSVYRPAGGQRFQRGRLPRRRLEHPGLGA